MASPTSYSPSSALPVSGPALYKQRTEELLSVGRGLALKLFLIYLALIFSRVSDFTLGRLHLPGLFFLMAIPAAIMCGALTKLTLSGPLRYLVAFAVWLLLAIPFSVWKGGSIQPARIVLMALVLFIPIVGLPAGFGDLRKMLFVVGAAVCAFSVVALATGEFSGGRIALEGGAFGNTNDLAQIVLAGIPFLIFLIYEERARKLVVGLVVLGLVPMGVALAKTGSRSLVLAVGAMFVLVFFRVSLMSKLRLLILAALVIGASASLLPRSVFLRFATFFSTTQTAELSEGDYESQVSALASTSERRQLFKESLMYTMKHPIFGVGPGMFSVARGQDREKQNMTGAWKVTHNAYTQISSECGIPALLFFVMALGSTFWALHKAGRYHRGLNYPISRSIRAATFTLQLALVSYTVFAFFLSIAYQAQMFALVAMAVSLERVSAIEREKLLATPPAPSQPAVQKFVRNSLPR